MRFTAPLLPTLLLSSLAVAQLSGPVGPTTSRASKAQKVCNVLHYGGSASKAADIGPAITKAFADCKTGGTGESPCVSLAAVAAAEEDGVADMAPCPTVYVPPGDYGMSTWVSLSGGSAWALQLDGIIYRTGTAGGHMLMILHTTDFELFSSTSKGAIQGYGYEFHKDGAYGARILRLVQAKQFSVHDIALVDAPAFHFVMDTCDSGEIYNMAIRGGNQGGLDGIDIWGSNIHVHDVEVTNKDECVTVKSPASNMLIENIYCNRSGGSAMGSLGADTVISNIEYRNIYTWQSNQMFMIKSNGGSGTVKNCNFSNFIGHSNAYGLDLDSYWASKSAAPGAGVFYSGLSFSGWRGTAANGVARGPLKIICPDAVPCTDLSITDFQMWTDTGKDVVYTCRNAYGSGGCLKASGSGGYASVTQTESTAPAGYVADKMANDLQKDFGIAAEIPIPDIPTTFFPGATPAIKLLGGY
ncbi:rhamnogalacturonan hydrolase [Marssonina coronariae]|uniref:Rhamnogalacturonan hydrolase n=1 Tax=Diplocarpon coronariae TaxID=2795749 RepID=A0A218ZI25_9HELO|nr:rhamnogalacturonan hydrolase [Marssonina coronariae]